MVRFWHEGIGENGAVKEAPRRWTGSLLVLALFACRERGDPVRESIEAIAKDARNRDAAAVAARLSADHRDAAGNGRSDVEQTLRGYFAAYEIVDVTLRDVAIERAEGAARARFRVDLSGQPRKGAAIGGLLPSAASYRFDVRLTPDGPRWRIAWAAWEPAR
jgi:hypothetical protein